MLGAKPKSNILQLIEVDLGEVGANVFGVAGVDVLPSFFHASDF